MNKNLPGSLGIVGGMGPYAGLDLMRKILDHTVASRDSDYPEIVVVSSPRVPDRTAFLLKKRAENPAGKIVEILEILERSGALLAGIPCNTAHARPILSVVLEELHTRGSRLQLVNMIDETVGFVKTLKCKRIGVLGTTGTIRSKVYSDVLERAGCGVVEPDEGVQSEIIHEAIYNEENGIKAKSNPVTPWATGLVWQGIAHLIRKGAEAVILGCTEFPLAVKETSVKGVALIDPTTVLARALIRKLDPAKVRPFKEHY